MSSLHLIRKEVIMSTTTKALYFLLSIIFLGLDVFVTDTILQVGSGSYLHVTLLFICPIAFSFMAMKCLGLRITPVKS